MTDHVASLTPRTRMGRPSLLTPMVLQMLTVSLRASANVKLACQHARVGEATYHGWCRRGRADLVELADSLGVAADEVDLGSVENLEGDWPYVHFLHETTKARNDFQLANLAVITAAAQGNNPRTTEREIIKYEQGVEVERKVETVTVSERQWSAAAWLLERRFPDDYARTVRSEVSGPDGGPVQVEGSSASEALMAKLAEMAERAESAPTPSLPPSGPGDGDLGANDETS